MNVNDSNTPWSEVSWAEYFDELVNEAWLESRRGGLMKINRGVRNDLNDDSKSATLPKESATFPGAPVACPD